MEKSKSPSDNIGDKDSEWARCAKCQKWRLVVVANHPLPTNWHCELGNFTCDMPEVSHAPKKELKFDHKGDETSYRMGNVVGKEKKIIDPNTEDHQNGKITENNDAFPPPPTRRGSGSSATNLTSNTNLTSSNGARSSSRLRSKHRNISHLDKKGKKNAKNIQQNTNSSSTTPSKGNDNDPSTSKDESPLVSLTYNYAGGKEWDAFGNCWRPKKEEQKQEPISNRESFDHGNSTSPSSPSPMEDTEHNSQTSRESDSNSKNPKKQSKPKQDPIQHKQDHIQKETDYTNNDICYVCNDGGELMVCLAGTDENPVGCEKSFHPFCIGRKKIPRGMIMHF